MALSGMVAMGEYSSGCVCSVKSKNSSKLDISEELAASTATAAAVGVVTQMRAQQAAAQHH
jgi:hypothetical protein